MFVIAGVTGHVGSVAARELISKGEKVKVIVRDEKKGAPWGAQRAEVAIGDLSDRRSLTTAFKGAKGVFVLIPPNWGATDILGFQKRVGAEIAAAVQEARVPHVVALSSNGADVPKGTGPIEGLYHFENFLRATDAKITSVRAGMFMENVAQGIGVAKAQGVYPNMLPSRDMALPMIATYDIGKLVAHCLVSGPKTEIVNIDGPSYSVNQIVEKISKALGKQIKIIDIPQAGWFEAMVGGGVPKPWAEQYVEMYQGFMAGKISPKGDRSVVGKTPIDDVIKSLTA